MTRATHGTAHELRAMNGVLGSTLKPPPDKSHGNIDGFGGEHAIVIA
jgi:hypothetical protein